VVGYLTNCNNTIIIAKNKDIIVFNVRVSPKKNQVHIEKLIILSPKAISLPGHSIPSNPIYESLVAYQNAKDIGIPSNPTIHKLSFQKSHRN
tara:strand:+ start:911 stop:1186 length:276 start_codon:yes stop_codon:yes gene_type:complete